MDDDGSAPTIALVPEGALSMRISAWSSTDPHTSVTATMPGTDGEYEMTVHTIVRDGERFSPTGYAHGVATDHPTLAWSAVWAFLASRSQPTESEDQRATARAATDAIEAQAEDAAAALPDRERWTLRPVTVAGAVYVHHVHAFEDGFAGFADLGPEVVTLTGDALPDPLVLTRRTVAGRRFL